MYDLNSFRSIEKLFYSPIEAAIRWCDLIAHEAQILELTWDCSGQLIPDTTLSFSSARAGASPPLN